MKKLTSIQMEKKVHIQKFAQSSDQFDAHSLAPEPNCLGSPNVSKSINLANTSMFSTGTGQMTESFNKKWFGNEEK